MPSLNETSQVYHLISKASIRRLSIDAPESRAVADALAHLIRRSRDLRVEDSLSNVATKAKKYLFRLKGLPLPGAHEYMEVDSTLADIHEASQMARHGIPSIVPYLEALERCIEACKSSEPRSITLALLSLAADSPSEFSALVVPNRQDIVPTTSYLGDVSAVAFQTLLNLDESARFRREGNVVAHWSDLERCGEFDRIYVLGYSWWYPKWLRYSPRALMTVFISPSWVRDDVDPSPLLPESLSIRGQRTTMVREPEADSYPVFAVSLDDLEPKTDWSEISSRASASGALSGGVDQDVEAKLYLLETQVAVYLDADPQAKVWILAPDRSGSVALERRTVSDLLPGMFVVIRTEGGGGDLIEIVADKLLGHKAITLREVQRGWKQALRSLKEIHGTEWIVDQLIRLGCSIANPVNVGNFLSAHYIRPNKRSDFEAIMNLIELSEESDTVWEAMSMLQGAHQSAGMALRKVLLSKAQEVDGLDLLRTGRAHIELSSGEGGRLTAFRILEIAPYTESIPSSRLNRPFEIED